MHVCVCVCACVCGVKHRVYGAKRGGREKSVAWVSTHHNKYATSLYYHTGPVSTLAYCKLLHLYTIYTSQLRLYHILNQIKMYKGSCKTNTQPHMYIAAHMNMVLTQCPLTKFYSGSLEAYLLHAISLSYWPQPQDYSCKL